MKTITIIPLGTPEAITEAAKNATLCDRLFLQTAEHPVPEYWLNNKLFRTEPIPLDEYYNGSFDFEELNERISDRLVGAFAEPGVESVGFAVLGRGAGTDLMEKLLAKCEKAGICVRILPSAGFAQAALAAMFTSGVKYFSDYDLRSAQSLRICGTDLPLVIEEVDTLLRAGEVKLALTEYYPDEFPVHIARMDENCSYFVRTLPLFELDRPENEGLFFADTVLAVPACTLTERSRHGFDGLMEVMRRLRAPGGCPWDAEQTHKSLRSSLIEESYEVLDALDREDMSALEEELGDLLLQIVFHAIIEEERREFTMRDVTTGIVNKLIYRHPHVFGNVHVSGADDVLVNWENLKQKEKHQQTVADAMRAVPAAFPALMRSYKIQKKAAHVGFDWPDAATALPKVSEEADEVRLAMLEGDKDHIAEEIGDLLFACVNVARLLKVDPELALGAASDKFMRRFVAMEQLILSDGKSLSDMCLDEMDEYWDRIKKSE
jgi:MazG family protein